MPRLAMAHSLGYPIPNIADLFAPVLRGFLVGLSLLSTVQGILLVQLEHLHLLLDGIHGCLVVVLRHQIIKTPKKSLAEGGDERQCVLQWRLHWSDCVGGMAEPECKRSQELRSVKYVRPQGERLNSFGHPILFWKRLLWAPSPCPVFFHGSEWRFAAARHLTVDMTIYGM